MLKLNIVPGLLKAALTGLLCVAAASAAAAYPDRPIRLIVGFPPGGGADFVARQVAQRLGEALNASVVVDNKAGANGTIAAAEVARAAADGYTLLLGVTASQSISPALSSRLPYDPLRDFTPITQVGYTPLVLVVNPRLPAKTLEDFLRYARASKTPVPYGSAGTGNITHMAAELFVQSSGVSNFQHIPYKGSSQVITDLIGGRVDAYFDTLPSSLPFIQSGQLQAIAVTSPARSDTARDIPTVQEAGVPGFQTTTWFGVLAPPKLDATLTSRLYEALKKGLDTPEARQALVTRGVEPVLDTPAQFGAELKTDLQRWRDVARKANIKLE
ncbi:Bug family tripartite tricarboxylate transporter substrate binding protein [Achromobacter deleyi]|uniref:Bug family tripartite tricarboxylate transporter substrate binding protein n=1 Tax=Achromobacter deleyi TaxID=1353891 RepID=UPI0014915442|nr:tripartite tricarboxylate transporter substrate binding protein [Achromobacter deleyi]QVQ26961.1 tripartite tricarboxylate transporter substrate binding protein [Achromobacter deleyi]UIP22536.1 tripartite tricarboxylate transporter substrate binding protein [Achromobacter deleyi]